MRDVEEVREELQQIAALPALARRRESIEDLANNLDTEEAHLWAKVDLYAAFGPDSIEVPAAAELASRAGLVELARNLLILTPLLITWIGISSASRAYGAMLEADPAAGQQPFIALWEGGFGGRTSMTLFRVGVADVIAFICVIGTSLWLSLLRRKIDVTVEAEERVTWNRLRQALLDASLHLNTKAFDTPARFNEEITRVAENLGDVTAQVDRASARAESAIESIDASLESLTGALAGFQAGIADQQGTLEVLGERVDGVANGLGVLTGRLAELGVELDATVAESRGLASSVSTGLQELAAAGNELSAAGREQSIASSTFLHGIQREAQRQEELTHAWTEATASASHAAAALSSASAQLDAVHAQMDQRSTEAARTLQATTTEVNAAMATAAQALRSSAEGVNEVLQSWQEGMTASQLALVSASQSLPPALAAASEQLRAAGQGLSSQSNDAHERTQEAIRASAHQMGQLTSNLQSTLAAISADVRSASEGMAAAVDRLTSTTAALESALTTAGQNRSPGP
jgi:chromosome segregation ATPase